MEATKRDLGKRQSKACRLTGNRTDICKQRKDSHSFNHIQRAHCAPCPHHCHHRNTCTTPRHVSAFSHKNPNPKSCYQLPLGLYSSLHHQLKTETLSRELSSISGLKVFFIFFYFFIIWFYQIKLCIKLLQKLRVLISLISVIKLLTLN